MTVLPNKNNRQAILLLGLSNGDEGKGTTTEFLVKELNAHTVIRYNGGSQAAHHVVTGDGITHCFAQFGSGTLISGTKTYLSKYMLINPVLLHNEHEVLCSKGISDAYDRLFIDEEALIITPFHKSLNKVREIARGVNVHGSCGHGVWETQKHSLEFPDECIRAKDLLNPTVFREKFVRQRNRIANQIQEVALQAEHGLPEIAEIYEELVRYGFIDSVMGEYIQDINRLNIVSQDELKRLLDLPGVVVFEGAQGVLLDANQGFFPYVTGTDITFNNANQLLLECGYDGQVTRLGITRAYMTRHGAGPFVTADDDLAKLLPEMHNATDRWQGEFRVGWFDLVVSRYAVNLAGPLDGLVITGLDRLAEVSGIKTCASYRSNLGHQITKLEVRPDFNRELQSEVTNILMDSEPEYELWSESNGGMEEYAIWLAEQLEVPLCVTSWGPTANDKKITNPVFEKKRDFFI